MPNFETPEPISVTIELGVGDVRITASDRTDTVVEVRPSDESDESDVKAAQQIRVDYTNGTLPVPGPKPRFRLLPQDQVGRPCSSSCPPAPRCPPRCRSGDFRSTGRLGECRFKTVRRERPAGPDRPAAPGHGGRSPHRRRDRGQRRDRHRYRTVQIGEIDGTAVVKNSNGDIDDRHGHRRRAGAYGQRRHLRRPGRCRCRREDLQRQHPPRRGGPRLGRAGHRDGRPGDRHRRGHRRLARREHRVRARAQPAGRPANGPEKSDETVEVRAHTSFGDITIRRS